MKPRRVSLLLLVPLLFLGACSEGSSSTDPGPLILPTFQSVFKAKSSGVHERGGEVILSQERWEEVWAEIHVGSETPGAPAPTFDFTTKMLVMAAMGDEADSCWDLTISQVRAAVVRLEVDVAETRPPASCTCPPEVIQPVHVVEVERADLPPEFDFRRSFVGVGCN